MRKNKSPSDSSIVITGVIRNGETTIRRQINSIRRSFSNFKDIHWFIVESDSADNTLAVLNSLAQVIPNFRFCSLGELENQIPQRTERLAHCRNQYLAEITSSGKLSNFDYIAVADLDNTNTCLSSEGVLSSWNFDNSWDAVFANQSHYYYDIYALRQRDWCPNDCWQAYNYFLERGVNAAQALETAVISKMIKIPTDLPRMIRVQSAFGGLGIYRLESIKGAYYCGLDEHKEPTCEHVMFHKQMTEQGNARLYINPQLVNCHKTEHNRQKDLVAIINRKLRTVAKKILLKNPFI
jgi:glycosyltransferase involved in cell wall biosynthesis